MRLLLTRPDPDGERSAARLTARGHVVLRAPLLRIEPVADAPIGPGPWNAVVATSANGLRGLTGHPRRAELLHLPLYAVGQRTAEQARADKFSRIISADGNATDLLRLIARDFSQPARFLYLAGEDRAGDLGGDLERRRHQVEMVVTYHGVATRTFPAQVNAALASGELDGVLHYSARSAKIFLSIAKGQGLSRQALAPAQFCLSEAVAKPLRDAGAPRIRVAPHPDEASLFDLLVA